MWLKYNYICGNVTDFRDYVKTCQVLAEMSNSGEVTILKIVLYYLL